MTRTSPPQVAFSSGEIVSSLHRRFDYQRFQTGLSRCHGFIPMAQGGFTRAPGTLHKGATRSNSEGRLVPFSFAVNDAVVLEFTNLRMRVWRYGALVMDGSSPYSLVTPYPTASLASLQWVQSADVIYMVDGLRPMQRLARLALDDWTIEAVEFTTGPFLVENLKESLTLQASGETGAVTITASAAFWVPEHVDVLFQIKPTDHTSVPLWTSNTPITVGSFARNGTNVYELTAGTNTGENPPIHTRGRSKVDNATEWRYLTDDTGVLRITSIVSVTVANATVIRRLPKGVVADPTYRWSEGAWTARSGYPSTVDIFDQRLAAAATTKEPRTVWFSTVGDFTNFRPGVEADESFAYKVDGDATVNRILHLVRGRTGLHILALGEEHSSRSDSQVQVIGPTNAVFRYDSRIGAHSARPIAPDGNPIFITRDRRRVVMMNYSLEADANRPVIMSRASQHIGNALFDQIVWQASPEPMAWLRRGDGTLAIMVYDAAEEVLGWATLSVAGGFVESLAVTPNETGTADEVTMIVRRTINGATVRHVETLTSIYGLLNGAQDISEACHFYDAADITPVSATALLSVPHLANTAVHVWSDKGEFGPLTASPTGEITLPAAVNHAYVGLFDATHYAETLDIQAAAPDGNTMGRKKRLHAKFGVGLLNTAQGFIQVVERDFAQPDRLGDRRTMVNLPVAATLSSTSQGYSGVAQIPEPSGFAGELSLRFIPYSGAPMTVTAVIPIVEEAGR